MYMQKIQKALCGVVGKRGDFRYKYDDIINFCCKFCLERRETDTVFYFIGNGGSAGIASHMATDYMKNGRMKTQTFYDSTLLTCMANDYGYKNVFSRPFRMMAKTGDVLIAISSSGQSSNILCAAEEAHKKGCTLITFTGFEENNPLCKMGNMNVYVPSSEYGIVESIHNLILQQIVDEIKVLDGGKEK